MPEISEIPLFAELHPGVTVQRMHTAVLPDGRAVVVVVRRLGDRSIGVIDAETGADIRWWSAGEWFQRGGNLRSCVYQRQGRPIIAIALDDAVVRQWDLAEGRPVGAEFRPGGPAQAVCAYPEGDRIVLAVGATDGVIRRFDADTGAPAGPDLAAPAAGRFRKQPRARLLALAAYEVDGRQLIASSEDGPALRLYDVTGGAPSARAVDTGSAVIVELYPYRVAGRTVLATRGLRPPVGLRDAMDGTPVGRPLDLPSGVAGLAAVDSGGTVTLVVAYRNRVDRFDAATGEFIDHLVDFRGGEPEEDDGDAIAHLVAVSVRGRPAVFVSGDLDLYRFDGSTGAPWPR